MNLISIHILAVFCWAVFFVSLSESIKCNKNAKILAIFSFICMLIVLLVGTKLMLLFPSIVKSGIWIHIKLFIDILLMLINIYLIFIVFRKKTISIKIANIIFWFIIIMFLVMYGLTLFRPF